MRIGIDIDDTLTNIKDKLTKAARLCDKFKKRSSKGNEKSSNS